LTRYSDFLSIDSQWQQLLLRDRRSANRKPFFTGMNPFKR
jgi:hypothetical protein